MSDVDPAPAPTPEPADQPALDLEQLGSAEAELADVEHAMARLDAGTWGTCEICGATIDAVLLDQRPAARSCTAHA